MKMFRQIIAWMVLACLLTGGIPLPASKAAEPSAVVASGTIGNITWTITNFYHETQGYISRNVLDVMGTGAIPDYNSCSLAPWFSDYNGKYLTEINIGSGITRIGEFAFYPASMAYTNQIDMVEIPDTVTEIGKGAFSGQAHLEYVKVPNSVVSIDEMPSTPRPRSFAVHIRLLSNMVFTTIR